MDGEAYEYNEYVEESIRSFNLLAKLRLSFFIDVLSRMSSYQCSGEIKECGYLIPILAMIPWGSLAIPIETFGSKGVKIYIDDEDFQQDLEESGIYWKVLEKCSWSIEGYEESISILCTEFYRDVLHSYSLSYSGSLQYVPISSSLIFWVLFNLCRLYNLCDRDSKVETFIPSLTSRSWLALYRYAIRHLISGRYDPELKTIVEFNFRIRAHVHGYSFAYLLLSILHRSNLRCLDKVLDLDKLSNTYNEIVELHDFKTVVRLLMLLNGVRVDKEEVRDSLVDIIKGNEDELARFLKDYVGVKYYEIEYGKKLLQLLTVLSKVMSGVSTNRVKAKLTSFPAHNVLAIMLFLNAMNAFSLVLPSVELDIYVDRESLESDERDKVDEMLKVVNGREIDIVIIGWSQDFSTRSLEPSITFIELTFTQDEISDRKEKQIEVLNSLNKLCEILRRKANIICRALIAMPCQKRSEEFKELEKSCVIKGVPFVCLEHLINPYVFVAYVLNTYFPCGKRYSSSTWKQSIQVPPDLFIA